MNRKEVDPGQLQKDRAAREELREKLERYFDLPLALASIVVVLLVITQLSGEVRISDTPWSKSHVEERRRQ